MGFYMFIISSADATYKADYSKHSYQWVHSHLCRFSGAISVVSFDVSALLLAYMAIERYIRLVYKPFAQKGLSLRTATVSIKQLYEVNFNNNDQSFVITGMYSGLLGFWSDRRRLASLRSTGCRWRAGLLRTERRVLATVHPRTFLQGLVDVRSDLYCRTFDSNAGCGLLLRFGLPSYRRVSPSHWSRLRWQTPSQASPHHHHIQPSLLGAHHHSQSPGYGHVFYSW